MTRLGVLRAGYGALGFAFLALAGSAYAGSLVLVGLAAGFAAGILLAFSDDDLPKYAGLTLVVYFVLALVAFLAATPITIKSGGDRYFANPAPPDIAREVIYWMGLVSPLILTAAGVLAVWERERSPRVLLVSAAAGFVLVGVLSVVLVPELSPQCANDPFAPGCEGAAERVATEVREQGTMLRALTAMSAVAAAIGTLWAAGRADEFA